MASTSIRIIRAQDGLTSAIGATILALIHTVWPPEAGSAAPDLLDILALWKADGTNHFVVFDEATDQVLAHAMIFRREIFTSSGPLAVGALAKVCVHPNHRGRGFGADVVRAAFDSLPELGDKVALFQTGVPHFYEKLGGRTINNRFFNGQNPENPFWDKVEMIFPASFAWATGPIDLGGSGY